MGRTGKAQLEERRAKVWELLVRGVSQTTIAEMLGVHRNTVANDVKELRKNHREDVKDADVHDELGDTVAKYDEIFKYAMAEYSTADKPRERAQFMDKALAALDKKTRLMVETGVLPKAAQEITGKMVIEGVEITKASLEELRGLKSRMLNRLSSLQQDENN